MLPVSEAVSFPSFCKKCSQIAYLSHFLPPLIAHNRFQTFPFAPHTSARPRLDCNSSRGSRERENALTPMPEQIRSKHHHSFDGHSSSDGHGACTHDRLHNCAHIVSQIRGLLRGNCMLNLCEHYHPCGDARDPSQLSVSQLM